MGLTRNIHFLYLKLPNWTKNKIYKKGSNNKIFQICKSKKKSGEFICGTERKLQDEAYHSKNIAYR